MKKIIIVISVLFVVVIAAGAIFIATFDANRYRPAIIRAIEDQLHRPVRIGNLSLGFNRGLSLQVAGIEVYPAQGQSAKPSLRVRRVSATLKLLSLLQKKIEVGYVVIEGPSVVVVKDAEGRVTVRGLEGAGTGGGSAAGPKAVPDFVISVFRIKDGEVIFKDKGGEIRVREIEVAAKNVSLKSPFHVEAQAAVLSDGPNFHFEGKITPPAANKTGLLEDAILTLDLSQAKIGELYNAFPELARSGLKGPMAGKVTLKAQRLVLSPDGMKAPVFAVGLDNGRARLAGGDVSLAARSSTGPNATTEIQAKASNISIGELSLPARQAARLEGVLAFQLAAKGDGNNWPELSKTLNGQGSVNIDRGVIVNLNVLREIFSKLSMVPGVAETIQQGLTPETRARLEAPYTALAPIEAPFTIQQGSVLLQNVVIRAADLLLVLSGRIGLDGSISAQSTLQVSPELSAAFARSAPQLSYLMNGQGSLEIPVHIEGKQGQFRVLPDMDYVMGRVAATKGQELITDLLQNKLGKKAPAAEAPQESEADPYGKLLKNLLN